MIIAKITKATPLTNPFPTCARCKADSTPRPSPGAPIIEAITTIDNESIVVWLIPAIIVFFAKGNSSLNNFCQPVLPNESDASTNSFGTWRMPKFVKRTVGGKAKITEANTPGTIPIPKKATAGIK
ncbi:hypothetical protein SDC9_174979 [bioreactor metagenome]|uniref:Uncharacterized protein n=1 Tax=bioreactor metagenome TaxID=1076179 RepID=A0A645GLF1_9ZZZZ